MAYLAAISHRQGFMIMPALLPTTLTAKVTYLGAVPDRGAALSSTECQKVDLDFGGYAEESHAGLTRPSDSRVVSQYPRGTEIRNTRQLSVVCDRELTLIAGDMGIDSLHPSLLGASMALSGFDDFSHIPPSSRLQNQAGTTLVVDMQNRPCILPAPGIDAIHPQKGKLFKPAAKGRRGVTVWVERPGPVAVGDIFTLHIPDQRAWRDLPALLTGE